LTRWPFLWVNLGSITLPIFPRLCLRSRSEADEAFETNGYIGASAQSFTKSFQAGFRAEDCQSEDKRVVAGHGFKSPPGRLLPLRAWAHEKSGRSRSFRPGFNLWQHTTECWEELTSVD